MFNSDKFNQILKINKSLKYSLLIVIAFIVFLLFFLLNKNNNTGFDINNTSSVSGADYININFTKIKVDYATTPAEQEQGLSGRESLKDGEGMFFVFELPDKYYFWMKDMNFPIDMIWFNESKEIIYIEKDVQPNSYPTLFGPDLFAKYILEVPAGFAEKHNFQIGDTFK